MATHSVDQLRVGFERVKNLDLSVSDFLATFSYWLSFATEGQDFGVRYHKPVNAGEISVVVSSEDVERALAAFLSSSLSSDELQRWANFLVLVESYEWAVTRQDVISSVLHLLATPEISGALNEQSVSFYLTCVKENKNPSDPE